MKSKKDKTIKLGRFREDPDNVSEATDEEIARLAGKLKRVPLGLTAMRIAYVTDAPGGGCMVISGNKRLRVLKQAYGEDGEVPAEWFADVTAMSEAERHEFRLNANVSDGHWNLDKLLAQYSTAELSDAGLDALLADLPAAATEEGKRDEDAVPDVAEDAPVVSKRGEVYALGRHRLMCGDSTSAEDVARLMADEKADLCLTDPPYSMETQGGGILGNAKSMQEIRANKVDSFDPNVLINYAPTNIYFHNKPLIKSYILLAERDGLNYDLAIYKKRGLPNYNAHLMTDIEYIAIIGKQSPEKGLEMSFYSKVFEGNKDTDNKLSYSKPVAICDKFIRLYSQPNKIILDLFGGSGTTLIACEQTNRRARLMELDPHYCDVIRRRWAEYVHGEGCDWEALTPNA